MRRHSVLLLEVLIVILFLISICYDSLNQSIFVPTHHLDGAFQTASGLFRIDAGEVVGKNFFPYLGVGPLYLLYPLFKLVGSNLCASVYSSHFMTLLVGWFCLSILTHIIVTPGHFITSLTLGGLIFFLPLFITPPSFMSSSYEFNMTPGNSLRPIRASLPYLIVGCLLVLRQINRSGYKAFLIGFFIGVSSLWSNDYSFPTIFIFMFYLTVYFCVRKQDSWRRDIVMMFSSAILFAYMMFFLVTDGYVTEIFSYNFVDLAFDQWWYFAPYRENARIFEFAQLGRLISNENLTSLAIFGLIILISVLTKQANYFILLMIGVVLFAGGSVASVGGHLNSYFEAFNNWSYFSAILLSLKLISYVYNRFIKFSHFIEKIISVAIRSLIVSSLCFFVWIKAEDYNLNSINVKNNPNYFHVPELGGFLGQDWKAYINYARDQREIVMQEEYWGIWSALKRDLSLWPVDSVIHAFGRQREVAKTAMSRADLVVTTRYSASPMWQPWSYSQNFWFYELVLKEFSPKMVSPSTVVWRRESNKKVFPVVDCKVNQEASGFNIIPFAEGFYIVNLTLDYTGSDRHLFMVRNNISQGWDSEGYVSIAPNSIDVTIPILLSNLSPRFFDSDIVGSDNVRVKITSCTAEKITTNQGDTLLMAKQGSFYLTDGNWMNGISRRQVGFFQPNRSYYVDLYKVDNWVRFANGEVRRIVSTDRNGSYLNIYVDGIILDSSRVGIPSEFSVIKFPRWDDLDSHKFFLTDANWIRGIARRWSGFFVPNRLPFIEQYRVGKRVLLPNGDIRRIHKITFDGQYLNVFLEGDILNTEVLVAPFEFKVVD
jgi:hypothetical protein